MNRGLGKRAFISHSSIQASTARWICEQLEEHDISCWIASRDVRLGSTYTSVIGGAIEDAAVLIVLFSAEFNSSAECEHELDAAFLCKIPVLPIRLDDSQATGTCLYRLAAAHYWPIDGLDVAKLAEHINTVGRPPIQRLKVDTSTNPDVLLAAAEEARRGGEMHLADELYAEVRGSDNEAATTTADQRMLATSGALMNAVQGDDLAAIDPLLDDLDALMAEEPSTLSSAQRAAIAARRRLAKQFLNGNG